MEIIQHLLITDAMSSGLCLAAAYTASVKFEYGLMANGRIDKFKINFASLALGFGTWAAQFISVLNDRTLAATSFTPWAVLASLALSILGAGGLFACSPGPTALQSASHPARRWV